MNLLRTTVLGALAASAIGLTTSREAHAGCTTANMTNFGNSIAAFQHVYAVYWGWKTYNGSSSVSNIVNGVLGDQLDSSFGMGGSKWINTEIQYGGDNDYMFNFGPFTPINVPGILAGSYYDEHNVPAAGSVINDTGIQNEVDYLVSNNLVSVYKDTIVMMMMPPGFATPVANACGQHFVSPGGNLLMWIPYPDSSSGCSVTGTSGAIVHELVESVVDPLWNIGKQGWTQTNAGCEIGDLCQFSKFRVQIQPQYNGIGLPSQVQAQPYWSNEYGGCVYARSTSAMVFGIGMDHKLWGELASSDATATLYGWNSWGSPGGNTASFVDSPGAASWGPNRLDVFALESGGTLAHAASDDGGSSVQWETLPALPSGSIAASPDAVSWGAGNVTVWVKGVNFYSKLFAPTTVWSNTFEWGQGWGGWTNWGTSLPSGVQPASKITVASPMATGTTAGLGPSVVRTVYAAFIDKSGLLQLATVANGVMTFTASVTPSIGGGTPIAVSGDPDMASWAPGRLDIVVRDTSGALYDCFSNDGQTFSGATSGKAFCWPLPTPTGGFGTGIGVAGMGDGRLLMVGRGASGTGAYEQFFTPTGSTGWMGGSGNGGFLSALDIAAL